MTSSANGSRFSTYSRRRAAAAARPSRVVSCSAPRKIAALPAAAAAAVILVGGESWILARTGRTVSFYRAPPRRLHVDRPPTSLGIRSSRSGVSACGAPRRMSSSRSTWPPAPTEHAEYVHHLRPLLWWEPRRACVISTSWSPTADRWPRRASDQDAREAGVANLVPQTLHTEMVVSPRPGSRGAEVDASALRAWVRAQRRPRRPHVATSKPRVNASPCRKFPVFNANSVLASILRSMHSGLLWLTDLRSRLRRSRTRAGCSSRSRRAAETACMRARI